MSASEHAMSEDDEGVVSVGDQSSGDPPAKVKKPSPGRKMTSAKRMALHPGEVVQAGAKMWCVGCQCVVDYRQNTFANCM